MTQHSTNGSTLPIICPTSCINDKSSTRSHGHLSVQNWLDSQLLLQARLTYKAQHLLVPMHIFCDAHKFTTNTQHSVKLRTQTRSLFNRKRTNCICVYLVMLIWRFCSCDLDLMTLIYKLDVDILKMQLCTTNNRPTSPGQSFQQFVEHKQDRQTRRQTQREMWLNALPIPIAFAGGYNHTISHN